MILDLHFESSIRTIQRSSTFELSESKLPSEFERVKLSKTKNFCFSTRSSRCFGLGMQQQPTNGAHSISAGEHVQPSG
jgi:hypothetical protein